MPGVRASISAAAAQTSWKVTALSKCIWANLHHTGTSVDASGSRPQPETLQRKLSEGLSAATFVDEGDSLRRAPLLGSEEPVTGTWAGSLTRWLWRAGRCHQLVTTHKHLGWEAKVPEDCYAAAPRDPGRGWEAEA